MTGVARRAPPRSHARPRGDDDDADASDGIARLLLVRPTARPTDRSAAAAAADDDDDDDHRRRRRRRRPTMPTDATPNKNPKSRSSTLQRSSAPSSAR